MISETGVYHGIAFSEILRNETDLQIHQFESPSNSSYVVNGVGLFVKYSTKRMSPWSFSFTREHQEEILAMEKELRTVVIALVCGKDGIASISYAELKELLDEKFEHVERIGVSRPPRGKYRLSGTDGKLNRSIGMNEFPGKLFHGHDADKQTISKVTDWFKNNQ